MTQRDLKTMGRLLLIAAVIGAGSALCLWLWSLIFKGIERLVGQ